MPPSTFNKMEGNTNTHWDALLEARAMYSNGGPSDRSNSGIGPVALIGGGLLLALVLIAMVLAAA